jgi:hypothetical protein
MEISLSIIFGVFNVCTPTRPFPRVTRGALVVTRPGIIKVMKKLDFQIFYTKAKYSMSKDSSSKLTLAVPGRK